MCLRIHICFRVKRMSLSLSYLKMAERLFMVRMILPKQELFIINGLANERCEEMIKKAFTIAGSDSGGGAGIQADLKTFQELGVYGMSAITAITAQNTLGVHGIYPLSIEALERQIDAVAEDLPP